MSEAIPSHNDNGDAEAPATITLRRACRRLGVTPKTAKRILAQQPGGFPRIFRIGHRLFMLEAELTQWLERAAGQEVRR